MSESKFARRMLEKQGWKEGDGLGKKRDGIAEPIKVNMKMDKTGVGHDPGSEFTNHWWLRVFNDAASSITKTSEVMEKALPQNNLYNGFRKGSTLTEGKEEKDSDCSSGDETEHDENASDIPTLDDIFKYCGGATGHRAATLGIKMKGKLHRAAEHERSFNEKMKKETESNIKLDQDSLELKTKRKKKRKDLNRTEYNPDDMDMSSACIERTEEETDKNKLNENSGMIDDDTSQGVEKASIKPKKKKSKKRKFEAEKGIDCSEHKTSKKKQKLHNIENSPDYTESEESIETLQTSKKSKHKKKKKKHKE